MGLAVSALSVLTIPVLGAIRFTAAGLVAGSATAAWQASIRAIQSGSLFTWCQSAAMGGAAMGSVQAVGIAGTALTRVTDMQVLFEKFRRGFRRAIK